MIIWGSRKFKDFLRLFFKFKDIARLSKTFKDLAEKDSIFKDFQDARNPALYLRVRAFSFSKKVVPEHRQKYSRGKEKALRKFWCSPMIQ